MNNVAKLHNNAVKAIEKMTPEYKLILALTLASDYAMEDTEFGYNWTQHLLDVAAREGLELDFDNYPNPYALGQH